MRYDPSWEALLRPAAAPTLFGRGPGWNEDAVCAELARLAYLTFEHDAAARERLVRDLAAGGFAPPARFADRRTGAAGFGTLSADGTAYAVFRGTRANRLQDWVRDIHIIPANGPGGAWVHSGFRNAERALAGQVDSWLASVGERRLVATGHSLGGAMASLLAARLDRAELVTFGCPRLGGAAFAASFEGRDVRRYVDTADVVARLPPPLAFAHLPGLRYIDGDGRVRPEPPSPTERKADRRRARRRYREACASRPGNAPARSLADHAPINYVTAILGVREGP